MALVIAAGLVATSSQTIGAQAHLTDKMEYGKYIDPLVTVKNFGIDFSDGGAADASILQPFHWDNMNHIRYDRPPDEVIAIETLGVKAVPLLIDCLNDGRLTAAHFNRTRDNKSMNVAVGYLCMDILSTVVEDERVRPKECNRDGLGWCIHRGFYFRPDDFDCEGRSACSPLPVVSVTQQNWRQEFVLHRNRIRFKNRFDNWHTGMIEKQSTSPTK